MAQKEPTVWNNRNRFSDGFRILQGEQEYVTYPELSTIRIWASVEACSYTRHNHSAIELIWTKRGEVTIETMETTYHIREGQILFIPPMCPHTFAMGKDSERLLFLFEPSMMFSLRDLSTFFFMWNSPIFMDEDTEYRREIGSLLTETSEIYGQKDKLWNTRCYSKLLQIFATLGRSELEKIGEEPEKTQTSPDLMDSSISYIKQHYNEKLMLDDIAEFMGFSRFYFSRTFKKYTGVSFSQFLQNYRLDMAKEKLALSEDSVQSIAFDCGFTSIATFNRLFQQHVQCTPTQYRLLYGANARHGQHSGDVE